MTLCWLPVDFSLQTERERRRKGVNQVAPGLLPYIEGRGKRPEKEKNKERKKERGNKCCARTRTAAFTRQSKAVAELSRLPKSATCIYDKVLEEAMRKRARSSRHERWKLDRHPGRPFTVRVGVPFLRQTAIERPLSFLSCWFFALL